MSGKLTSDQARRYWRQIHDETADPLAAVCFPTKSRHVNKFFDEIQRDAVRRALGRIAFQGLGARVLDVGCGRGRWLTFYKSRGADATGIDLSETAVAECLANGLTAVVGDITSLAHEDGAFDLVNSITVLLHLPPDEQAAAARELERVTRPGGHILLLENTGDDPSSHVWARPVDGWIALFAGSNPVWVEGHYYAPLLRGTWRRIGGRLPARAVARLEDVVASLSLPLELALMRLRQGRRSARAWQHVIVLRKRTTSASA
jgi:SAM-dependent methyltransferase